MYFLLYGVPKSVTFFHFCLLQDILVNSKVQFHFQSSFIFNSVSFSTQFNFQPSFIFNSVSFSTQFHFQLSFIFNSVSFSTQFHFQLQGDNTSPWSSQYSYTIRDNLSKTYSTMSPIKKKKTPQITLAGNEDIDKPSFCIPIRQAEKDKPTSAKEAKRASKINREVITKGQKENTEIIEDNIAQ